MPGNAWSISPVCASSRSMPADLFSWHTNSREPSSSMSSIARTPPTYMLSDVHRVTPVLPFRQTILEFGHWLVTKTSSAPSPSTSARRVVHLQVSFITLPSRVQITCGWSISPVRGLTAWCCMFCMRMGHDRGSAEARVPGGPASRRVLQTRTAQDTTKSLRDLANTMNPYPLTLMVFRNTTIGRIYKSFGDVLASDWLHRISIQY